MDNRARRHALVLLLIVLLPVAGLGQDRCERLFQERSEVQTCFTLLGLTPGISDKELAELVSQQVHGTDYATAQANRQRRIEIERRAAEERAATRKQDRCSQLFASEYERDVCRWQRMFSSATPSDAELSQAVARDIERMENDPDLKQSFAATIKTIRENDEQDRVYEQEFEKRRAVEARAKKAAEAKAREREKLRQAELKRAADQRDAVLKTGEVGFLFTSWELGGFGSVLIARFGLQNNANRVAKDFTISCDTSGESGTGLGAVKGVLYSSLGPGQRRFFELNLGIVHPQTAGVRCGLSAWK